MPNANRQESIVGALNSGYSPDAIEKEMIAQGIDRTEAISNIQSVINADANKLYENRDPKEVYDFLKSKGFSDAYIPKPPVSKNTDQQLTIEQNIAKENNRLDTVAETNKISDGKQEDFYNVGMLNALYDNIASKHNTVDNVKAFMGDEDSIKSLKQEQAQVTQFVASGLVKHGVNVAKVIHTGEDTIVINQDDPRFYNLYANTELGYYDESGTLKRVDSTFLQQMYASIGEVGGAITGAAIGAKTGASVGTKIGAGVGLVAGNLTGVGLVAPEEVITLPAGAAAGRIIGGIIGAIGGGYTGAFEGKAFDITMNAYDLGEKIQGKLALEQMHDAGISDAIYSVVGNSALKVGTTIGKPILNSAVKVTKNIPPTIDKAKSVISRYMSETEQDIAVREWEKLNGLKAGTVTPEQALGISVMSDPVTASVVAPVVSQSHSVGTAVIKNVDSRAKQILEQVTKGKDPLITRRVTEDLNDYISGVKAVYTNARLEGAKVMKSSQYNFDFDKLILDPIDKKFRSTLSNPDIVEKVETFLINAKDTSKKRDFRALLDMRKNILDLKHELSSVNMSGAKVLDDTIKTMDKEIKNASKLTPEGKEWYKAYEKSNEQYGQMLDLKQNVLYKALTRDGVNVDKQIKSLKEYITAEDGTFVELTSRLPDVTRKKVEAEVLDTLVNKFTVGAESGVQAIDFPLLAKELQKYPFRFKEQRDLKRVINMMSKVYKTDPDLAAYTSRLRLDSTTTPIATTLTGRAKQEIIRDTYTWLSKFKPTKAGAEATLASKLAKVLENPMHQKSVQDLLKALPDEQIEKRVQELQIAMFKEGKRLVADIPRSKVFRAAKIGEEFKVTSGPIGRGIYYTVDETVAKSAIDAPLKRVNTRKVADYALADETVLKEFLGDKAVTKENVRKFSTELKMKLEDQGYSGYKFGNDVLLFD